MSYSFLGEYGYSGESDMGKDMLPLKMSLRNYLPEMRYHFLLSTP